MVFLSLDDVISQQGCAKAALDLAEQMIDPASNMLNVASQYEQLAKRAEHRVGRLVRKLGQVGFGRPHTLMEALSPARAGLFLGAAEVPLVIRARSSRPHSAHR
jgi:hypothetical protein